MFFFPFKILKLQIVDSVIALFRVDFTGRGELAERQVTLPFLKFPTFEDSNLIVPLVG